ncbi:acyl-CoA thioesterase [Aliiglaciecola sp. 3_MG-2023]|uniref:acyl-CoA thioesterase n=1 Tax=Aliiglaciecola sp. 3_MG-2023 TaxID=3062644 RepID=UPI0034A5A4F6
MIEAQVEISIPFHDIDVMRIAWHGHYVKYLEIARCALFDKMAYNFPEMEQSGYAWPVIDLHIRYASALSFQQQIIVKAKIVEWENRLKINYQIVDKESGKRLTKASTVQVAVEIESKEMMFESPPILFEKLGLSK